MTEPMLPFAVEDIKERAAPGEPDRNGQIDWLYMGDDGSERYTLGKFERFIEGELLKLSELLGQDRFYGGFKNDVFWIQDDFPDPECNCGYDNREVQFWVEYNHAPDCASHRETDDIDDASHEEVLADPDRFFGTPCDCYVRERFAEWQVENHHDRDCPKVVPRFRCGDIEFCWYKHIGRRMRVNRTVTHKELKAMFERCFASLQNI